VDPRDPDVEEAIDAVAEEFGGHGRLFRHRDVRGARRHHQNRSLPEDLGGAVPDHQAAGLGVGLRPAQPFPEVPHLFVGQTRDENPRAGLSHRPGDRHDLLRRLPLAEDHLGDPLPDPAMVVDVRPGHRFVRQRAQALERLFHGDGAGGHIGEHFFQAILRQGSSFLIVPVFRPRRGRRVPPP
jgi:hypothetical protein